jgi:hypothetical protein
MIPVNLAFAQQEQQQQQPQLPMLTAEWWQWSLSIPTSVNPLLEGLDKTNTGPNCTVGQRDVVWFLAGTFSPGVANRMCSIPANAALLIPIANSVNINTPFICGQAGPLSVETLRAMSKSVIDGVNIISVKVDNKQVKGQVQRVQSQVFEVALPQDNLFNAPCEKLGKVPAGIYSPAVDDGYYLLLQPLTAGSHTIQFQVKGSIVQDVTYTLTVIPVVLQ